MDLRRFPAHTSRLVSKKPGPLQTVTIEPMNQSFKISLGDDPDSDRLFAEIVFDQYFAEIQEPPPYQITIYPRTDGEPWDLPIELVLEALYRAKSRLDDFQERT